MKIGGARLRGVGLLFKINKTIGIRTLLGLFGEI